MIYVIPIILILILDGLYVTNAYAELDFEINPSLNDGILTIGYGYTCGEAYQKASGITTLTLSKIDNGWTSILKYYDSDYDLVHESVFGGNEHVMSGVVQYWDDKQLSGAC